MLPSGCLNDSSLMMTTVVDMRREMWRVGNRSLLVAILLSLSWLALYSEENARLSET